jgi:hypothetical protein
MRANYHHQEADEKVHVHSWFFVTWGNKQSVIANNYIPSPNAHWIKSFHDVEAPNKDQSQKATSSL